MLFIDSSEFENCIDSIVQIHRVFGNNSVLREDQSSQIGKILKFRDFLHFVNFIGSQIEIFKVFIQWKGLFKVFQLKSSKHHNKYLILSQMEYHHVWNSVQPNKGFYSIIWLALEKL